MDITERILTQITDLTGTICHVLGTMDKRMDELDKNFSSNKTNIQVLLNNDYYKNNRLNGQSEALKNLGYHFAKLEGRIENIEKTYKA